MGHQKVENHMDATLSNQYDISDATIEAVARDEKRTSEAICQGLEQGTIVVLGSADGPVKPLGIGAGLRTKVNANIGTSPELSSFQAELHKLEVALAAGADAVMDLSTGGDLDAIRRGLRAACPVSMGTVPIYQVIAALGDEQDVGDVTADDILAIVETHAADGIDFLTLHCGVTRQTVAALAQQPRICGIVSRGGAMLANWMQVTGLENPLYEQYDAVLDICKAHGSAISLGDGLRPGAVADASDAGQIAETVVLGELVLRARQAGVQAFVEGPGHMPLDQIKANVILQKRLCHGAPFYVLGPLTTDIAPGYDHITGAIGGALCAAAGADFLCYVTPAEHLGLPTDQDVWDGVIASRIAAHSADLVKGVPAARDWDDRMSRARADLDWTNMHHLAIDPGRVSTVRGEEATLDPEACSMCGRFCSMKVKLTDRQ
jgi:phosphomethylpyrimidine synthase